MHGDRPPNKQVRRLVRREATASCGQPIDSGGDGVPVSSLGAGGESGLDASRCREHPVTVVVPPAAANLGAYGVLHGSRVRAPSWVHGSRAFH